VGAVFAVLLALPVGMALTSLLPSPQECAASFANAAAWERCRAAARDVPWELSLAALLAPSLAGVAVDRAMGGRGRARMLVSAAPMLLLVVGFGLTSLVGRSSL
jgi:hypothetical protein